MDTTSPWLDALRELLCKMYEAWGGDCDDLGSGPAEWINKVQNEYDQNGAPSFANSQAKEDFLNLLDQVIAHLNSSGNSLTTAQNDQLRTLVQNLKNDINSQNP